jgi:K+-transporting ATPase ATPase C chain
MLRLALRSLLAAAALTAVCGFAYPGLVTGIAQLAFPNRADGSILEVDGKPVGSRLVAQAFNGPEYFHPRPSATDYDATATSFSNLGPTSAELSRVVRERAQEILALERPYDPGLALADIPVDAVTASGSGIDPHISPAYAHLQTERVAATRRLSVQRVEELVRGATDGRALGFFGEPGVNVLELNLALDRETR